MELNFNKSPNGAVNKNSEENNRKKKYGVELRKPLVVVKKAMF
jgi:hypothetical protein